MIWVAIAGTMIIAVPLARQIWRDAIGHDR